LDLRSRLELYNKGNAGKARIGDNKKGLVEQLGGSLYSNVDGESAVIERCFPLSYIYGGYALGTALNIDVKPLHRVFHDLNGSERIDDFIFLDTETTGLSGGTGTVAFLVGAGFFTDDMFVLRQYFMRDYDEEPAMLRELAGLLSTRKGLVTFNGKAFDWNLLITRFMFNRLHPGMQDPVHMDLLYPSRALWRDRLESCKLTSLEENILGEYRIDDIPGAMIPAVYFSFLEDRDLKDIKRVLEHNRLDILTLVSLLARIHAMLSNPLDETECEEELLGLGKIFARCGEFDNAISCLGKCPEWENGYLREKASIQLTMAYKRQGDYSMAERHWTCMISRDGGMKLHPMIELAKYYEHRKKDIGAALEMTEKAMEIVRRMGELDSAIFRDLKKRAERLRRKIERKKQNA
jgi:uncharacterized protein YprB with RNaseH-like and TPR domain